MRVNVKQNTAHPQIKQMPILQVRQRSNPFRIMLSKMKGRTMRRKTLRREELRALLHCEVPFFPCCPPQGSSVGCAIED